MISFDNQQPTVADLRRRWPAVHGRGGGGGKGGGSSPVTDPNTMRSKAKARLVEAISEGPILGLVDGERSIYFDETPLLNADGTYNFKGVVHSFHHGYADEGYFNGHSAVETPHSVETQVKASVGPVQRTIVDENADAVRVVVRIPSLVHADDKGNMRRTNLSYVIEVRGYNGQWQVAVQKDLIGEKALSPFQIAHRVELPFQGSPWDVRVRRLTADSTDDKLQNDLWWEGYVVLVEGKFIYPHTAAWAAEMDAEQMGSSIPPRSYHVRGLLVNVPSNYDPFTRQYSGIWNGSFKIAWTNNPTWVFYDLLVNDRYGLGEFIDPAIVDKWSLYTIAQYCDQLVPSGYTNADTGEEIWEPRFTYNGTINSRDEAFFVLQSITQAWRGMAYWAMGQVFATADIPADPSRLVTPANVIGGEFDYAGTAIKARHSVVLVKWNNPDDHYRPDTEVVIDDELLKKYGWREKSLQLRGCTSRGLAHRYGKWVIDTEQHETDTLTYAASWDHAELRPGELIAVSDPRKAQIRAGGRIVYHRGLEVQLDYDFEATEGETYSLILTLPNGQLETRAIAYFLDERTLQLAAPFSAEARPDALWSIKGSDITPRLYRVLTVEENEPNQFKIAALFHDPQKFDRVERDLVFEPLPYDRPSKIAIPPTNLRVIETGYISNGAEYRSLTFSWTAPANFLARGFVVSVDTPEDGSYQLGFVQDSYVELKNTTSGVYRFYVQTVGYTGAVSAAAQIDFEATGPYGYPMPQVVALELVDNPGSSQFNGRDVKVRWQNMFANQMGGDLEHVRSPHYAFNTVRIYHGVTGELLRTERSINESYTYDYLSNAYDCKQLGHSGPTRSVRVDVTVSDIFGRTSSAATRVFSNPVPAPVVPTYQVNGPTIFLGYIPPEDADFEGVIILRAEAPGELVDPDNTQPLYEGDINPLTIPGDPEKPYWFRIAAYDAFGKEGLTWSTEFVITTMSDGSDVEPPDTPTGLAVTSEASNARSKVTVSWNSNTEEDLAGYDLQIREDGGNWLSYSMVEGPFVFEGVPSITYQARVRARDRNANASPYSDVVTHVAARDEVPPALPGAFTVSPGMTSLWLSWTNPADADFAYVEIHESATEELADATLIGTAAGTSFARSGLANELTRHYWLRAVDTSDNKSEFTDRVSATTAVLPDAKRIQIVGLTLTPNDPEANNVSWTSFQISYGIPGKPVTTMAVSAGAAPYNDEEPSLYLYYVEGESVMRYTDSISTIFLNSGHPIAVYRGGTDVELANGKAMLDGANILAETIGAAQLVVNDAVITNSLQLKDAVITSAKILELDAAKLKAGTAIAGSIIVGGEGGDTLEEIMDRAENPAGQINNRSTQILPGKILISGGTTLADWRSGGDSTKINGGAVAANSLAANTAVIGMRGITIDGLTFEHNSPSTNRVSWTVGTIAYTNNAGAGAQVAITADNVLWTAGTLYLYWVQGETILRSSTDFAVANQDNHVVLATYRGGVLLFAAYGRTIIDGGQIKAQSIETAQLKVGAVTAEIISVTALSSISGNIGTIVSGMLRSSDALMQIDLNNRRILIADYT
ncbi:MAG: hypothetical protein DI537_13730 [Stutzerimonas stutzeri]|nr:MAG: hypothetical protein DI537_13730 [Stutzerimonas stutzeri]